VLGWSDNRAGLNDEKAYVSYSANRGASYRPATAVSTAGDRANQQAVAIAPDGSKVYVTYNAWHQPWQTTTANARPMEGVVLSGPSGDSLIEVNRGASGDARGSSANSLTAEFLGDYNYAVASNTDDSTSARSHRTSTSVTITLTQPTCLPMKPPTNQGLDPWDGAQIPLAVFVLTIPKNCHVARNPRPDRWASPVGRLPGG